VKPSLILRSAAQFLMPLLLLFSLFMLLRGHHEPGGGFIAGLIAAAAIALRLLAVGLDAARQTLHVDPRRLLAVGLLVALAAALWGPLRGEPFFSGMWGTLPLPLLGKVKLGTPLLFDFGVYLVVIGSVLTLVITLAEHDP
jgi:multicomponent Na+:H+ antiporter subunit B